MAAVRKGPQRKTPSLMASPAATATGASAAGSVWGRDARYQAPNLASGSGDISEVVRVAGPVGPPLLQERVATLPGFLGAVYEASRFAGEELLTDQAIVG